MSDFQLDVTQPSGETVTITAPDAVYTYNVLPLTKSRVLHFAEYEKQGRALKAKYDEGDEEVGIADAASSLIDAISGLLGQQNGGPPAATVLHQLWDEDYLGFGHLERLTEHLALKAGGSPPA